MLAKAILSVAQGDGACEDNEAGRETGSRQARDRIAAGDALLHGDRVVQCKQPRETPYG
jgi:hypothetical protein